MTTKQTKIRALNVEDLFTVTDILVDAVDNGSSRIGDIIVPDSGGGARAKNSAKLTKAQLLKQAEKQGLKAATTVLRECWKYAREPMQAWCADLCGMDLAGFKKAPASIMVDLVEFFTKDPDNRDFFSRALSAVSQTNDFAKSYLARLGLSDTTTDSEE